jgi:hypothetical protein
MDLLILNRRIHKLETDAIDHTVGFYRLNPDKIQKYWKKINDLIKDSPDNKEQVYNSFSTYLMAKYYDFFSDHTYDDILPCYQNKDGNGMIRKNWYNPDEKIKIKLMIQFVYYGDVTKSFPFRQNYLYMYKIANKFKIRNFTKYSTYHKKLDRSTATDCNENIGLFVTFLNEEFGYYKQKYVIMYPSYGSYFDTEVDAFLQQIKDIHFAIWSTNEYLRNNFLIDNFSQFINFVLLKTVIKPILDHFDKIVE